MEDSRESKRVYRQPLNYENGVLLPLIRDIAYWRITNKKAYDVGVKTFVLILPRDLRKQALGFFKGDLVQEDLTSDGKKDMDDMLVFILNMLEDNNICFPKISYDVGHD